MIRTWKLLCLAALTLLGVCVSRPALAQQGRNGRRRDFADRVMVVVAGEADEPEVLLAQQRSVIEHLEHAAHPARRELAVARMGKHQPDLPLPAKRDAHA